MPQTPLAAGAALLGGAASAAAAALALHPVFGGRPAGARLARMEASPHWRGGRFHNLTPDAPLRPSVGIVREWLAASTALREPSAPVATARPTAADVAAPAPGLAATWLGHGTALVDLDGHRFLTDPVWGRYASPGRLFGVARFFEPPLALNDLPPLDAVVLTHDHYDHLDAGTVRDLADRVPRWIAPLGVGAHLERWGVPPGRITELDWWEETAVGTVRLTCTPSRHFSGRSLTGRNGTLWCGWAFAGTTERLWLSGDGGFGGHFAEIGARLGPFDLSLVEVGAYDARWADVHLGPEQAVRAHVAARGGVMVPVHWATFNLAFHGWTEPAERALVAAEAAGVTLAVPRPGERVRAADPPPVERWWPAQPWRTAAEAPVVSS